MNSSAIKEYGLSIGYSRVGIIPASSLLGYIDEVNSRGDLYNIFDFTSTNPAKGANPCLFMPEAKSVIVLLWDYYQYEFPENLKQLIGKVYLARCYNPPKDTVTHARLNLMREFLEKEGVVVDTSIGIPARWAAAQAGIVDIGKNTFAYSGDSGSYIQINTMVVNVELEYDKPTGASLCKENCSFCMDNCPTNAIYEPYKMNPYKCIAFNNWMTQDGRGTVSSFIPYELREKMGTKIHGCDICQDVCPHNQRKLKQKKNLDPYTALLEPDISLADILNMTDEYYERRIKPLLYNYIKDKRYFMRNAAIAIGNSKDEKYLNDLELALSNPDAMVRKYVVWALGKIGNERARGILSRYLTEEKSEEVKEEIAHVISALDELTT